MNEENNVKKIVTAINNKQPSTIKQYFNKEVASRVLQKIDIARKDISKRMFK